MPSPSSSPQDNQSIWDILDALEASLLHSIHQTSDLLLPQLIHTSQSIYSQIEAASRSAYDKSLELASDSNLLQNIIPNQSTQSQINPSLPTHPNIPLKLVPPNRPSLLSSLLRPRNIVLGTGVFFASRFALDQLLASSCFQNFVHAHPSLRGALPRWIKARAKRNSPLNRPRLSAGRSTRREAVVVLGADPGTAGHQIAVHLAEIGFVVIASVSRLDSVSVLERDGQGWLKALVLDAHGDQTAAFNRSLGACLSLRFPLNSPGAAFVSDANQSWLVGLVNCLPVCFADDVRPVESIDSQNDLVAGFKKVAGISLEVVKLVLPMIRNSVEKFGAQDGVILTLFPIKTTSIDLPYLSASIVANQALESLMVTLRRELLISDSPSRHSVRIINEKIGGFRPSAKFASTAATPTRAPSLPVHLHAIYAPSLSRRVAFLSVPTTSLPIVASAGSPLSYLLRRVERVLQTPRIRSGATMGTGSEAWKYGLISTLVPSRVVDLWLVLSERINGWVRQKVVSEVDLESQETLERVISKRNFSAQSTWKAGLFAGHPPVDDGVAEEEVLEEETGSLVDKGEEQLQESFLGSEIDWKAGTDGTAGADGATENHATVVGEENQS